MVTNIRYIKGVGPSREKMLNRIGIFTLRDIFYYFPLRYEDRRDIKQIKDIKDNDTALIKAEVLAKTLKPLSGRKWRGGGIKNSIFEIAVRDDTSIAKCVWFNQGYLNNYIDVSDRLLIYGRFKFYRGRFQAVSPEFEVLDKASSLKETEKPVSAGSSGCDSLNAGRIVGFYRLTKGLSQKVLRKIVYYCVENLSRKLDEPLPYYIREKMGFPNIYRGLRNIHFPDSLDEAGKARQRFIFEELFFSQILVYIRKARYRFKKSVPLHNLDKLVPDIENNLPFKLTLSQKKSIREIMHDLEKPYPMHRLLQGDVGSGKTVVACFAIAAAVRNGYQAALMVPTEVLAHQHFDTLSRIFKKFGFRIEVLTSGLSGEAKRTIYRRLEEAEIDIIIGTHSLIEDMVNFKSLGVAVIDEQHKFGVAQRALLPRKAKNYVPHCLVMSATPIPRSMALSLYGDLDISVINELPPGRKEPDTIWVDETKRKWVYNFLKDKLKEGRQAYIIYPLIEESDDENLKSLSQMHKLVKKEFSSYTIGMLHGRMKSSDKEKAVSDFKENRINILISTTVVEVGVNIENAVVMVVENPERFGLAQLHQLRGRIRRSTYKPYMILISNPDISGSALERLKIITKVSDGFKIAEEDLKLRGPGDFFGSLQAGFPQLKIADPLRDISLLEKARSLAYKVVSKDPYLKKPYHRCIIKRLDYWLEK